MRTPGGYFVLTGLAVAVGLLAGVLAVAVLAAARRADAAHAELLAAHRDPGPDAAARRAAAEAEVTLAVGRRTGATAGLAVLAVVQAAVGFGAVRRAARVWEADAVRLRAEALRLGVQVGQDPLTGLANRRTLDDRLAAAVRHAKATGAPLAVAALDLDHFKRVNDTHGHGTGDDVLRAVATRLQSAVRADGLVCRPGGEEFVVVLPGVDGDAAAGVGERLRAAVGGSPTPARGSAGEPLTLSVTASVGLAVFDPDAAADGGMLLRRADRALYASKQRGRDRVTVADPAADTTPTDSTTPMPPPATD